MNSLSVVVLLVAVAAANAGVLTGHPVDSAAVLSGPSGTVVRSGIHGVHGVHAAYAAPIAHAHAYAAPIAHAYAAPVAVAHHAPVAVAHHAVAPAIPHHAAQAALSLSVPAGSGLEGQWIPDINEKLFDDGSYKPHVYGF